MKKLITICMAAIVALSFASCKKEGVYKPKEKISKIYKSSDSLYGENHYQQSKYMAQEWEWNKNLLKSIEHYNSDGDLSYIEDFTFDKNNRLTLIEDLMNNESNEYTYDGNYLKKIEYYINNRLEESYEFTHDGNTITKMEYTSYGKKRTGHLNPLQFVLPECIANVCNEVMENAASRSSYSVTTEFTWEKNNITKAESSYAGYMARYSFEYDTYNNPFCGFYDSWSDDFFTTFSKNNITEYTVTETEDGESETETVKYNYSYDGKFPSKVSRTQSYDNSTYTSTTYYEYD